MNIKANLFYSHSDYIVGLEGDDYTKKFKRVKVTTVSTVREIFSNWKQPVAYCFYNTVCPGRTLKVKSLNVVLLVSDMGSSNIESENMLKNKTRTYLLYVDEYKNSLMFLIQ